MYIICALIGLILRRRESDITFIHARIFRRNIFVQLTVFREEAIYKRKTS